MCQLLRAVSMNFHQFLDESIISVFSQKQYIIYDTK